MNSKNDSKSRKDNMKDSKNTRNFSMWIKNNYQTIIFTILLIVAIVSVGLLFNYVFTHEGAFVVNLS